MVTFILLSGLVASFVQAGHSLSASQSKPNPTPTLNEDTGLVDLDGNYPTITPVIVDPAFITPQVIYHGEFSNDTDMESFFVELDSKMGKPAPFPPSVVDNHNAGNGSHRDILAGQMSFKGADDTEPKTTLSERNPTHNSSSLLQSNTIQFPRLPVVKITANGPFLSVDTGKEELWCLGTPSNSTTINGPFKSMQISKSSMYLSALRMVHINGTISETIHDAESVDAGTFTFEHNERITDFFVYAATGSFYGFNFTTDKGRNFSAVGEEVETSRAIEAVRVPVGSGILARMRISGCFDNIESVGFDFIDELDDISVSEVKYLGFVSGLLPAGKGELLVLGSQHLDNRDSIIEQSMMLQTTSATTKQRSITMNSGWHVGGSIGVTAGVDVPFVAKLETKVEANWGLQRSEVSPTFMPLFSAGRVNTAKSRMELASETITHAATTTLRCPAGMYCSAVSQFTKYSVDVDILSTIQAKTATGQTYSWSVKGKYKGIDSLGHRVVIHTANSTTSNGVAGDA